MPRYEMQGEPSEEALPLDGVFPDYGSANRVRNSIREVLHADEHTNWVGIKVEKDGSHHHTYTPEINTRATDDVEKIAESFEGGPMPRIAEPPTAG